MVAAVGPGRKVPPKRAATIPVRLVPRRGDPAVRRAWRRRGSRPARRGFRRMSRRSGSGCWRRRNSGRLSARRPRRSADARAGMDSLADSIPRGTAIRSLVFGDGRPVAWFFAGYSGDW